MKITNEGQEKHRQSGQSQPAYGRRFGLPGFDKKRQYSIVKTADGDQKWLLMTAKSGRIGTGWQKTVVRRSIPVKEKKGKPIAKALVRPASPSNIC